MASMESYKSDISLDWAVAVNIISSLYFLFIFLFISGLELHSIIHCEEDET